MKKFILIFIILIVFLSACSKNESPPPPPQEPPPQEMTVPGHGDIQMPPPGEMEVIIPPYVKKTWKWVRLTIEDKEKMSSNDFTIEIGGKISIPDTGIEIQTAEFLPDLKIEGNLYTTATTELLNPAIHVIISQNGKEIFDGWLFQKFPTVHPFKHPRFRILFKEPVSAS